MTDGVKVSVVTSVFDGEPYLRESLESLSSQTGVEIEFILIDDGSTDGSEEIVDAFARRDARFRVFHRPHAGLSAALKFGCDEARGAFIARHDADDVSLPGRLAAQAAALDADPTLGFVSCGVRMLGPRGEWLTETVRTRQADEATRALLSGEYGPTHGSVMFRKEIYRATGGYRSEFRHAQDVDLWLRIAEASRLGYLPEILYAFRVTENTFRPRYRRTQKRLARLAHDAHRARAAGRSDEGAVDRAAAASAASGRPGGSRAPGAYFIGSCLIAFGDARGRDYLWDALWSPRRFPHAAAGLARSRFRLSPLVASPPDAPDAAPERALFICDARRSPSIGAGGSQYRTIEAMQGLGVAVDSIWAADLPHRIGHPNLHHLVEQPRAYRRQIRRRLRHRRYQLIVASQPHCYLAARDHRRARREGMFLYRSHGLEQRVDEVVRHWRQEWNEPEKGFPRSIFSIEMRRLLDRHADLAERESDGTIVFSSQDRDFLIRRKGLDAARVAVILPGAPPGFLEAPPAAPTAERHHRVLYAGQLAFFKAPRLVAEAFRSLAGSFPDVAFTWVCDERDHPAVAELLGSAAPRCRLVPWMTQTRLREVFDDHGIFLFPSLFEGSGKSCLEAMARGLAVVTSNDGGMRDLIVDGENGFLVPVGDAAALISRAEALLRDAPLWRRTSAAAREAAEKRTWERNARETLEFAERLRARRQAGGDVR